MKKRQANKTTRLLQSCALDANKQVVVVLHTATCAISMQTISPKLQTRVWKNGFLRLRNCNSLLTQKQHPVLQKLAT
ncbi:MAG: hypothetical protein IKC52_00525 [Clostridia bacterium]|nr:hypothetical protein [Clostridia bacterium]